MSELVSTDVVAFETRIPRADMVLACPGRLADLIEQGQCHLGDVETSVLDEADHMTDLGFLPVVRRILDMTPPGGQRMLFSAVRHRPIVAAACFRPVAAVG